MYSKTLYNYHYVSSPQRYKTCFLHLWNTGSHHFMDFQAVKNQKHLTVPAECIFGLISWKFDVCSWSCISSGVSRVSSVTSGVQGGLKDSGSLLFHQSPFHKPKVGRACYFVECVLFYAESTCRGNGNFMFGVPHSSVPGCWVSFLSKPLVAWKAVW